MSYIIGIDFGTTSLAGVILEIKTKKVLHSVQMPHNAFLKTPDSFQREQDLSVLEKSFKDLLMELLQFRGNKPPEAVGFTGQMHGIIGLNPNNEPLTNLVTWQDKSGERLTGQGITLLDEMKKLCPGLVLAHGYGLVTLYKWLKVENRTNITSFCTLPDYFSMLLTQNFNYEMDKTMAHSIGAFNISQNTWDINTISGLGLPFKIFPPIARQKIRGFVSDNGIFPIFKKKKIPVCISIGDNQAAFVSSVLDTKKALLINAGTGAQVCFTIDQSEICHYLQKINGLDSEIRPYNEHQYLVAYNFTAGGSVYQLLFDFFRQCGESLFDLSYSDFENHLWNSMSEIPLDDIKKEPLKVIPLFDGLRSDPSQKGQIQNISFDNFTPRHLIYYTLWGLAELFRSKLESDHLRQIQYIVGSGNAIKKNKLFQSILSQVFNKKIDFSPFDEEAATGAALNALMALKELMPSK